MQEASKTSAVPSKKVKNGPSFVLPSLTFQGSNPLGASARADLTPQNGHFGGSKHVSHRRPARLTLTAKDGNREPGTGQRPNGERDRHLDRPAGLLAGRRDGGGDFQPLEVPVAAALLLGGVPGIVDPALGVDDFGDAAPTNWRALEAASGYRHSRMLLGRISADASHDCHASRS